MDLIGHIPGFNRSRVAESGKQARRIALSLAILITFQFSIIQTASPAELPPKRVLILFAVNVVLPTHLDWERGIRSGLQSPDGGQLEIDVEYADLLRFKDEGYTESFVDLLRHKYASRKLDVVIPVYDPAFEFIEQHGDSLFPGAAVVFCSVNQQNLKGKNLGPNVTGVLLRLDFNGTIALARHLWPQTKRVAVVAGVDVAGQRLEAEARQLFANESSGLEYQYFSGIPLNELKDQISQLPSDTAILMLPFVQDVSGTSYSTPEVATAISVVARAPVFGLYDTLLGHGLVGGHVVSLEEHGRRAGEIAARVLGGQSPSQIPAVGPETHRYEFDWRELRRWGISERSLPAGSVVLFREPTFWDFYKWHVIGGAGIIAAQSLAILGLLASRRRRERAEKRVTDLAGRLLTAQEEERRHLARELHDDVTQRLAISAIEIDKLERAATTGDGTTEKLRLVKQSLVELSEDVHGLSRRLHPQIIEDLGLVAALRVECERFFDRQGIQVQFNPVDVPVKLPRGLALCTYRVIQEGLWNIAKHAHTAEASLELRCAAGRLYLRIADGGVGFDKERSNGGLGMVGMAERVNLFQGKMIVHSKPGAGTQLAIEMPIPSDVR